MKIKNVKEEDADYLKNYLIEHVNKKSLSSLTNGQKEIFVFGIT